MSAKAGRQAISVDAFQESKVSLPCQLISKQGWAWERSLAINCRNSPNNQSPLLPDEAKMFTQLVLCRNYLPPSEANAQSLRIQKGSFLKEKWKTDNPWIAKKGFYVMAKENSCCSARKPRTIPHEVDMPFDEVLW